MIIQISKVLPDGAMYDGSEPAAILELEGSKHVRVDGDVHYHLQAKVVSGELVVTGAVSVPLSLHCSRCAEFFSTSVGVSSFLRAYEIAKGVESVDLTPDIREDILLNLPSYPVCSPGCKGLCPQCGRNLNLGPCSCRPPEGGHWGAFDGLKL